MTDSDRQQNDQLKALFNQDSVEEDAVFTRHTMRFIASEDRKFRQLKTLIKILSLLALFLFIVAVSPWLTLAIGKLSNGLILIVSGWWSLPLALVFIAAWGLMEKGRDRL